MTPAPCTLLPRRALLSRRLAALLFVTLGASTVARAALRQDETNMLEVRSGELVSLPTHGLVDLAAEGAVEFWYRHQTDQVARKAFTDKEFVDEAYSVVLAVGAGAERAFAVIVGPGTRDDQASVGVLNDLSALTDRTRLGEAVTRLSKLDDFGGNAAIPFVKGATHHILITKQRGRAGLRVFVDGRLQGTLRTEFGATLGKPVVLGEAPAAFTLPSSDGSEPTAAPLFPFEGFVGGLRLWRTGDFNELAATRLARFKRSVDLLDLTMLPEYGALTAYADFVGERWDPARRLRVRDVEPRLRPADPLAGAWYAENAVITQTRTDASVFDDYPVFTFVPATATAHPVDLADRAYHVFEDSNFVGRLAASAGGGAERWTFQHADDWAPLQVEHLSVGSERKLRWSLAGMPRGMVFAGATSGAVTLKRRTIVDLGIASPSVQPLSPQEEAALRQQDDMTLVFLYSAYPKFYDLLYSSYNIVKMDPWNLLETGSRSGASALRRPSDQMFQLDKSEQMIMPYDLEVLPSPLSLDSSQSTLTTSASDYNAAVTSRIGGGVSGSVTVGTGAQSPVSVSGTVNMHVVVQKETVRELARQDSASSEKILRSKWEKRYTLLHRKEVLRLSDEYADALRLLYAECAAAPPAEWRRRTFAFFDTWGTHYPLAIAFGSLDMTETTVDDEMRMASLSQQGSFEVTVNDGKSGDTNSGKQGSTTSLKTGKTVQRAFGTDRDPAPIAVDLRPLHDLLTPQQFPHEPELYVELRHLLGGLINDYRAQQVEEAIADLDPVERARGLESLNDLRERPSAPPEFLHLRVRYTGLEVRDPESLGAAHSLWKLWESFSTDIAFDCTIDLVPSVTRALDDQATIDLPPALRQAADTFLAANPPVRVIGPTLPTEERRLLRFDVDKEVVPLLATPPRRELLVKVPRGALEDYAFVQVRADFDLLGPVDPGLEAFIRRTVSDEDTASRDAPYRRRLSILGALHSGASSLEPWYLLRSELHRPPGRNPRITMWGERDALPFDAAFRSWSNAGGLLWVNDVPAVVTLSGPLMSTGGNPPLPGPTATLQKSLTDAAGRKFVFKAPVDGTWRKGETVLPVESQIGHTVMGTFVEFVVTYEYALLPDFKDSVEVRSDLLPESTWGSFSPGAKVMDVNPLARRTTTTLRPPPAAPLADTVADRGTVLRTHSIRELNGDRALATRGFGTVDLVAASPTQSWTFIEEEPGIWLIVSTFDNRVLAFGDLGVPCCQELAEGAMAQRWIAKPVDGQPSTYEFASPTYGHRLFDSRFVIDPPLDLTPNAQLKRTVRVADDKASAHVEDLAAFVRERFQPLRSYDPEVIREQFWRCIAGAFDANRDGVIDAEENQFFNGPGPLPITASSFAAALTAEELASPVDWLEAYGIRRASVVCKRVVKGLDLDYSGWLEPAECHPILAHELFSGVTFGDLDWNPTDGKVTDQELRGKAMSQASSLRRQQGYEVTLLDSGPNKIEAIKALRAALGIGLREAKDLIDGAPCSLGVLPYESQSPGSNAQALSRALFDAGAKVEVR